MNWILTFIFIPVVFLYYRLLGTFIADLFKISNIKKPLKVVLGFLGTYLLSFLVGVPCQFFHVSWNVYFVIMSSVYLFILLFCIYTYQTKIQLFLKHIKTNWKSSLLIHFKEYWFIYVMVIISSLISMSNQMPYYYGNYDDSYYIGKVINQVGSIALSNEEYANGALIPLSTITIERILNTYELTYGYFASVFQITIPFFCRATMVIHNYIIVYVVYKCFAELFVSKKHSQYAIIVFSLFWISNGYLSNGWEFSPYSFRMFDAWQMQTAIFYGSSVVRTIAMPILIIFGKDLIQKITIRRIVLVILISCSFLSFSTIYIQLAILLGIAFSIVKLIYMSLIYFRKNRHMFVLSVGLCVTIIGVLVFTIFISDAAFLQTENAKLCHDSYLSMQGHYVGNDIIMKFFVVSLLAWIIITKDKVLRFSCIAIFIYYLFFIKSTFVNLMTITSFNYFFVSLRSIAALQYVLLVLSACIGIYIVEKVKFSKFIMPIFSTIGLTLIFTFFITHIDRFMIYTHDGSGANKDGYSLKRVLQNQYMVPELVTEIGNFLDTLPYGNYKLLGAFDTPYDKSYINVRLLTMTSNRAEIYTPGAFGEENNHKLNQYFKNKEKFSNVINFITAENVDYILIFDEKQLNDFVGSNYKVAFSYEHDGRTYYLMALSEQSNKLVGDKDEN